MLWGAYNGLFLTLDRLFLRDALQRCGKLVATSVTLFIVMIGWAIFRSENTAHIAPFLAALFGKSQASGVLEVPPEVPLALVLGAVISLFPATRLYPWLVRAARTTCLAARAHHRRAARDLSAGAGARVRGAVPALHLFQVLTMSRFALSRPLIRLIVGASLALLPLVSAWNLLMPNRQIQIGPTLGGVTNEMPVVFSWSAIRDGSFQKAVANRVTEAFALRRMLIRINNEVRMELFGELTAPHVVRGARGQLIERTLSGRLLHAHRGPGRGACGEKHSKAEGYPELLSSAAVACSSTCCRRRRRRICRSISSTRCPARARRPRGQNSSREYVAALKQAGINVLDTATLIHQLKGAYDFDLFPQGGVHWNDVGGARAVTAIVDEINRQAGRPIVPSFTFTYALSRPVGADRELADLLNVFFPPLAYLTPKVRYTTSAPCADHPARLLEIAMVGSSFSDLPARILIEHNCLARLNFYYYARLGRFGGTPYRELQRNLGEAEMRPMRDARIMILEENEAFAARNGYVDILRDIVTKP